VEIGKADGLKISTGEAFRTSIVNILASGIGGICTTGDLVARIQMSKGMKIAAAKKFVASKFGINVLDLTDEHIIGPLREERDIGVAYASPGVAKGIMAKYKIAEFLDIDINSVNHFKDKLKLG
jgi:dimethylamine--corrinoid protein Co-methyltransferase